MKLSTPFKVIRTIKNWPVFFADRAGLLRRDYVVYVSRGGVRCKTRSKTSDAVTLNMVWVHGFYTPDGYGIEEDDVIVDVGAHIGTFSVMASNIANHGRVYAFEPEPENFSMLEDNIDINRLENVAAFNLAVSGNSGEREFFVSEDNVDHSLHFKGGKKTRVKTITLKKFMKVNKIDRIDFLKMDCEGVEYEILFKSPDSVLKNIRKISMEYHDIDGERSMTSLKRFLEKKGFSVKTAPERKMLYAKKSDVS